MGHGQTIGLLSPFVGGDYYGAIIAGVAQTAAARGASVLAIQTLDPGSRDADRSDRPDFRHRIAWDYVDSFVVIVGAVSPDYVRRLRRAGKTVVLISHEMADLKVPAVVPDNVASIGSAVDHLVAHGHRRIAFAGFIEVSDIHQRHQGYLDGLIANGIAPDPDLVFRGDDNHESGGEEAAEEMIRAGMPATAVIVGTDRNAIGLMARLTQAGYEMPRDLAVIGYDDITATRYLTPSLSSVRQHLGRLGQVAVQVVTGEIPVEPSGRYVVPSSFVARESCGCATGTIAPGAPARPGTGLWSIVDSDADARTAAAGRRLADDFAALAPQGQGVGPRQGIRVADAAVTMARLIEDARSGRPALPEARLRPALEELYRFGAQPQTVSEIAQAIRSFVDTVCVPLVAAGDIVAVRRVERVVQDVLLHLAHIQARIQFQDVTYLQDMLNTQYELGMDLLRSHEQDPRELDWLRRTPIRGGCLGLWPVDGAPVALVPDAADLVLRTVGEVGCAGAPWTAPDATRPIAAFPPSELFDLADGSLDEVVFVVPVRSADRDWGLLATAGTIQAKTPAGRELMNQSGALLAVALDQEAMLGSLREQEEGLRRAALYDHLTGLPNRSLFLDRLEQAFRRRQRQPDRQFGVLFLDLDGFKAVNDTLGHDAGDELLVEVARRLETQLRGTDTAARFGGDEFLILLDLVADDYLPVQIAGRLSQTLSEPFPLTAGQAQISASIGVALSTTGFASSDELLRAADAAMYEAKSEKKLQAGVLR